MYGLVLLFMIARVQSQIGIRMNARPGLTLVRGIASHVSRHVRWRWIARLITVGRPYVCSTGRGWECCGCGGCGGERGTGQRSVEAVRGVRTLRGAGAAELAAAGLAFALPPAVRGEVMRGGGEWAVEMEGSLGTSGLPRGLVIVGLGAVCWEESLG